MDDVEEFVAGYRRFRAAYDARDAARYRDLAANGQAPHTMVIACSDSRVDPATILNAGPGQLFVVRNVANLVPPYVPDADHHGTGAALEFAVTGLNVKTIVVMGHCRCGGVRAFLEGEDKQSTGQSFIDRWVSLLRPAHHAAVHDLADAPIEVRQKALERHSIQVSIENLKTFPFIQDRVTAGTLRLRGAYFDIADGKLLVMDPVSGDFAPLT